MIKMIPRYIFIRILQTEYPALSLNEKEKKKNEDELHFIATLRAEVKFCTWLHCQHTNQYVN